MPEEKIKISEVTMLHEKKRIGMGSSEFNVDVLSDDIWEAIFLLLPIRTVFRLKCLSKAWKKLISKAEAAGRVPVLGSGYIYKDFYDPHLTWKYGSLSDNGGEDSILNLKFLPCIRHKTFKIEQTCGGLLLCSCSPQCITDCLPETIIYFVCNPLTKTWMQLPKRPKAFWRFDPFVFPTPRGRPPRVFFLVDPYVTVQNFRIIRFFQNAITDDDDERMKFDIYSSETEEWDIVTFTAHGYVPADVSFYGKHCHMVYARGVLYALARNDDRTAVFWVQIWRQGDYYIKLPNVSLQYRLAPCESFLKELDGDLYYVFNVFSKVIVVYKLVEQCSSTWDLWRRITMKDLLGQVHPQICNEIFVSWSFLPSAMRVDFDVLHFVETYEEVTEEDILYDVDWLMEEGAKVFSYHLHMYSNRLDKFSDARDELRLNYFRSASSDTFFLQLTPSSVNLFQRYRNTTLTLSSW